MQFGFRLGNLNDIELLRKALSEGRSVLNSRAALELRNENQAAIWRTNERWASAFARRPSPSRRGVLIFPALHRPRARYIAKKSESY